MVRNRTVEEARAAVKRLMEQGNDTLIEIYRNGTGWHTDTIGLYVDDPDTVPDDAVCAYQIMDADEYDRTLLANCSCSAHDYMAGSDRVVVVSVETDDNGYIRR